MRFRHSIIHWVEILRLGDSFSSVPPEWRFPSSKLKSFLEAAQVDFEGGIF